MFQSANANSTYFYNQQTYYDLFSERVSLWTKQHGLPPFSDDNIWNFFQQQWTLHTKELLKAPRFTFQKIKHLQQWLPKEAILHHADHEQAKLTIFCPRLYFQGAWKTWNDPDLFRRLPISYDEAQMQIQRSMPDSIQKKYKWAILPNSNLPYGFVFLKRKKQFAKGRTLISYFQSRYGRLLQVTARTIDSMLLQLWPQTMGQLAVPQIWDHVHRFFDVTSLDASLCAVNDDLVGFFNSVPQQRLLDAVQSLIVEWNHHHPDTVLSVDMSQKGNPVQLSFVGKIHRSPKKTRVIHPQDIFPIVQASLSCHIFQALNVIWQQIRGAGIGSHISPSLSNLAVTIVERSWQQAFKETMDPPSFPFLAIRYVDNRYILFPDDQAEEPSLQVLSSDDFYQHPVELETVTTNELLGFLVDPVQRTVTYKLPETWQIRDFASAGSIRLRLSGLQSRCHLISRYSYPQQEGPDLIHSLILLYGAKGFSISDCYKAIRKLQKRFLVPACVPLCVSQTLFRRAYSET